MEYQGNAHSQKEEPQKEPIEKVVTGPVIQKKKSFAQRFKGIFLGGDIKNAARYITADVILPSIRNLFVDATTRGVERVVFGESSRMQSRRQPTYGSRIQYNSPVNRGRAYLPDQPSRPLGRQVRRETNDLVLTNRAEAELVLERLSDIIDKYSVASIADLHQLIGHPSSHIDHKWGWVEITGSEIRQVREGYLLDLPPAEEI